jgi:tRNA threonylcarbamoyladenosine modification (KEOPS) complex  Pcc1 subunit
LKARATVRLPFSSKKQLDALVSALKPEINRQIGVRSKAILTNEPGLLLLNVEAEDTVALRAALNAYLRWINSMVNVFCVVEDSQQLAFLY